MSDKPKKSVAGVVLNQMVKKVEDSRQFHHELMLAIKSRDVTQLRKQLDAGAPLNDVYPAMDCNTPLMYCTELNFFFGVNELLNRGANVRIANIKQQTALHLSIVGPFMPIFGKLIRRMDSVDVRDRVQRTPLHYASRLTVPESYEIAQALLKKGACPYVKDSFEVTPLHNMALLGNIKSMSLLFEATNVNMSNTQDLKGQTPLHYAVIGGRDLKAVKMLLDQRADPNVQDITGKTPLHLVTCKDINSEDKSFDLDCLELLLSYKSSTRILDKSGCNALHYALEKTAWWNRCPASVVVPMIKLLVDNGSPASGAFSLKRVIEIMPSLAEPLLNHSLSASSENMDSQYIALDFNFAPLIPTKNEIAQHSPTKTLHRNTKTKGEMSMIKFIASSSVQSTSLLHNPLCRAFLNLKWLKVRKLFVGVALFYFIFVISLTHIIHEKYECLNRECLVKIFNLQMAAISCIFCFIVSYTLYQVLKVISNPWDYFQNFCNYLNLIFLFLLITLFYTPLCSTSDIKSYWCKILTCVCVVSAWFKLMMFMGNFPICGVYTVMFLTVCKTVIRIFMIYFPLMMAFSIGFYIVLNEIPGFQSPFASMMSSLVMLTGETNYQDNVVQSKNMRDNSSASILIILFIIFIYIVFSNLLVALAVNDMASIQKKAETLRLQRQLKMLNEVEQLIYVFTSACCKKLRNHFKLVNDLTKQKTVLSILPNYPTSPSDKIYLILSKFLPKKFLVKVFDHFIPGFLEPARTPLLQKSLLDEALPIAVKQRIKAKRKKASQYATRSPNWQHRCRGSATSDPENESDCRQCCSGCLKNKKSNTDDGVKFHQMQKSLLNESTPDCHGKIDRVDSNAKTLWQIKKSLDRIESALINKAN